MVRVRMRFSPGTFAPSGGLALAMRASPGVLRNGTLRCFSTLAAADRLMALAMCPGTCASTGAGVDAALVDSAGMVMVSPQEGHSISVPAPALSTASSCSQLGQSKTISISAIFGCDCAPTLNPHRTANQKKIKPPSGHDLNTPPPSG